MATAAARAPAAFPSSDRTLMKRFTLTRAAVAAAAFLVPTAAHAQTNIAINVFDQNGVTLSGVLCGFDCNDPGNVGAATVTLNDLVNVQVRGDVGSIGIVAARIGPPMACPGLVVPGWNNDLLLFPDTAFLGAWAVAALAPLSRGSCGLTGFGNPLTNIPVPIALVGTGAQLTFQGLTFDAGVPTFTRPVLVTIM